MWLDIQNVALCSQGRDSGRFYPRKRESNEICFQIVILFKVFADNSMVFNYFCCVIGCLTRQMSRSFIGEAFVLSKLDYIVIVNDDLRIKYND